MTDISIFLLFFPKNLKYKVLKRNLFSKQDIILSKFNTTFCCNYSAIIDI